MKRIILTFVALVASFVTVTSVFTPQLASAVSASDFNAGRIIDDGVFFNGYDMSPSQIQQFFNAKVPTCDENGSQQKSYRYNSSTGRLNHGDDPMVTTSRAVYGQRYNAFNGVDYADAPYYCLKDYHLNTPSRSAEAGLCNGYTGRNGESSAEIIYNIGVSCGVNPKALIVLLQKEQGLVTDDWPWDNQYLKATGYACPDTAPCDSQYYGFFNQVYSAARQFKRYAQSPNSYNHKANRDNSVRYNPNAGCGSSTVFIQNQATAGLYNYTPYQPNAAALSGMSDNSPGGGDSCSAYGNRNFFWYFSRWFGSTTQFNGTVMLTSSINVTKQSNAHVGDTVSANFTVGNTASYPVDIGGLGICGRLNGQNFDFGFQNMVSLPANGSTTMTFSRKVDRPGILSLFICSYNERLGGWAGERYPYSAGQYARSTSFEVRRNPLITTGVTLSPEKPTLFEPVTASFTIHNNSTDSINIPSIGLAARDPSGANVGFPGDSNVTIAAGGSYTYSKTRSFTGGAGMYRFWVTSYVNNVWNDDYPLAVDGVARTAIRYIDNPAITTGLTLTPANPTVGQSVTASFVVENNSSSPVTIPTLGVAARDPSGANVGFPAVQNLTISANSSYTYSQSRTFTGSAGNYSFWITSLRHTGAWDDNYPAALDDVIRRFTRQVYDNPVVSTGLSLSPTNPTLNQSVTASFTLRNTGSSSIVIPAVGVAVRDAAGANVGFPAESNVTIPAGGTYTYSKSRTFTANPGNFRFWITSLRHTGAWDDNYPVALPDITRQFAKTIN